MKPLQFLLLAFLIISCTSTRSPGKHIYLDETGNTISSEDFQTRWRSPEVQYARWDYKSNTARVTTLSHPTYQRQEVSYSEFRKTLEKITGKEIPENTIFLLEYTYMDDLCSSEISNNWNKTVVKSRKNFLEPIKGDIKYRQPQVLYLEFFEEGIRLQNDPGSADEYFYNDKENFLRNTLFKNPTFCGSSAIVKPNGQAFIRNGENRADWMAEYLEPETWNQLFPEEE